MLPANLRRPLLRVMLGARCLASCCPVLRLALPEICHRRSRRHPAFAWHAAASVEARSLRVFAASASAWPRPCPFTDPKCGGLGALAVSAALLSGPVHGLSGNWPRSHMLQACLHSAEASCTSSYSERVNPCCRHPWDQNHRNFKALRLSVSVAPRPEDKLNVRLNRRSDNILSRDFSTGGDLPCGHGWISQRLVAFRTG